MDKKGDKKINDIVRKLNEIQKENPNIPIKNEEIKTKIAKACLSLIKDTPVTNQGIMETSYTITGKFGWCNYNDKLDEIMDIAGELELPEHHVSGDIQKMWKKMETILKEYIQKNKASFK